MRRSAAAVLATVAFVFPLAAQTAVTPHGSLLRVNLREINTDTLYFESRSVVGTLLDFRSDTLFLGVQKLAARPQWFPVRYIASVERSVGQYHPYARSTTIGAISGAALGLVVGIIYPHVRPATSCASSGCPVNTIQTKYRNRGLFIGAALGLTGGALSAAFTTRDRWEGIALQSLH